ncbi:hypothetical protein HMI54_002506 [Coelomomyces lativittatus]|nr:hypothetical protein HMI54_002506 [Coelomomyces lativittatus]
MFLSVSPFSLSLFLSHRQKKKKKVLSFFLNLWNSCITTSCQCDLFDFVITFFSFLLTSHTLMLSCRLLFCFSLFNFFLLFFFSFSLFLFFSLFPFYPTAFPLP